MSTNQGGARRFGGELGESAEEILEEARKALVVMLIVIAVIWAVQVANWADSYGLDQHFGIVPRDLFRLPDILTAPFLHVSWTHIESNSGPLFVFGFLAAFRGVTRFLGVTAVVIVTSGLGVWLFQSGNTLTVGASGVIYGYFGYVIVKGLFDRRLIDVAVGVVMALSFAYILVAVVPGTPGVSWVGHLSGLVGGIASGWLFRARRAPGAAAGSGGGSLPGLGFPDLGTGA
jgi:membrane associated rhomboid family serine protease